MKKIVLAAWAGVRVAGPVFLLMAIVFGLIGGAEPFLNGYTLARWSAAAVLIGLGFGIPSLVYETELHMGWKVLIHMGIGCIVMIGATVLAGWLNAEMGIGAVLIALAAEIVCAFLIWGAFLLHTRALAKRMSERIARREEAGGL